MSDLPAVIRPNGKSYQPRKLRAVLLNEGVCEDVRVLVLGTHDEERARVLADDLIRSWDRGYRAGPAYRGWWRSVIRNHDPFYAWDELHGAAGLSFELEEVSTI